MRSRTSCCWPGGPTAPSVPFVTLCHVCSTAGASSRPWSARYAPRAPWAEPPSAQALEARDGLGPRPVALVDEVVADAPLRVDEERLGELVRAELLRHIAGRIEQD